MGRLENILIICSMFVPYPTAILQEIQDKMEGKNHDASPIHDLHMDWVKATYPTTTPKTKVAKKNSSYVGPNPNPNPRHLTSDVPYVQQETEISELTFQGSSHDENYGSSSTEDGGCVKKRPLPNRPLRKKKRKCSGNVKEPSSPAVMRHYKTITSTTTLKSSPTDSLVASLEHKIVVLEQMNEKKLEVIRGLQLKLNNIERVERYCVPVPFVVEDVPGDK